MNYLHLLTLIWFSRTLCAKHYLVETKDNVSHTDTTPSSSTLQESKLGSKILANFISASSYNCCLRGTLGKPGPKMQLLSQEAQWGLQYGVCFQ